MRVTPRKLTEEEKLQRFETATQQALSAMLWAWLVLACCAGDAVTALLLLILKSLIWGATKHEGGNEK